MKDKLLNRFLRYVSIDMQSNAFSPSVPSTPSQLAFANMLAEELVSVGLTDVSVDEHRIVMGFLASNSTKEIPSIGFLAHLDTACGVCGKCNPQIVTKYDGSNIIVNEIDNIVLDTKTEPAHLHYLQTKVIINAFVNLSIRYHNTIQFRLINQ